LGTTLGKRKTKEGEQKPQKGYRINGLEKQKGRGGVTKDGKHIRRGFWILQSVAGVHRRATKRAKKKNEQTEVGPIKLAVYY